MPSQPVSLCIYCSIEAHELVIDYLFCLCLLSIGEPDSPVVLSNEMKVEGNSFSVPLKQSDDGGTPMLHFDVRYRQVGDAVSPSLPFPLNNQ